MAIYFKINNGYTSDDIYYRTTTDGTTWGSKQTISHDSSDKIQIDVSGSTVTHIQAWHSTDRFTLCFHMGTNDVTDKGASTNADFKVGDIYNLTNIFYCEFSNFSSKKNYNITIEE